MLLHNIEGQSYEKYLLNQTNFEQTLPIGVATYTTSAKLPASYQQLLPDGEKIAEKLDGFFGVTAR